MVGPAGHGKSTALAALLDEILREGQLLSGGSHVLRIEVASGAGVAYTAGAKPFTIARHVSAGTNYAPVTVDEVRRWSILRGLTN